MLTGWGPKFGVEGPGPIRTGRALSPSTGLGGPAGPGLKFQVPDNREAGGSDNLLTGLEELLRLTSLLAFLVSTL